MHKLLLIVLTCLIIGRPLSAQTPAPPNTLHLELKKQVSEVKFIFQSPIISTKGEFQEFSGNLTFDHTENLISSVIIYLDFSKFTLMNQPPTSLVALTALANSLPSPKFKFESTKITQSSPNKLKVEGILTGSGKSKAAVFYAIQKQLSPNEFNFIANVSSKDFEINWPKEIAVFGEQYISGEVHFDLIF